MGQLAGRNPDAAFFRSMGLNDDGTQPGTNVPAAAPELPSNVPTVTVGTGNRPPANGAAGGQPVPAAPAPRGVPPVDPAGTLYPERDVAAFEQYLQGTGGYMPPTMAVAAAPGQAVPAGANPMTTQGGARFFVDAGANPMPATGQPSLSGMPLPSFDQFRAQNMNSGIGANTPALIQRYLQMQGQASGIENTRGTLGNHTLEANTRWGPNGLGQQELNLRQGELALTAAQAQLRASSWGRRAQLEGDMIRNGMPPADAARRVDEMERQGKFDGQDIDMTQIPGLPGYVPRSPTGTSPLPPAAATPPAVGGAQPPIAPAAAAPAAAQPGSLLTRPPVPRLPAPPGPVYEALGRQIEAQFPRPQTGQADTTPGALVMRLQQAFPQLFTNTPEGLRNRAAIFPYLNSRFNPQDVARAAQGTHMSPLGAVPRSDLNGLFGFMPAIGRAAGYLSDGGDNMTPDLEGRALMQSMRQGRW